MSTIRRFGRCFAMKAKLLKFNIKKLLLKYCKLFLKMNIETKLHILKADYGDAFILSVTDGSRTTNIVIDSGPAIQSYRTVTEEWEKLDKIDLLIITHYDYDHSGSFAIHVSRNEDFVSKVKKFWLNCPGVVKCDSSNTVSGIDDCKTIKDKFVELEKKYPKLDWRDDVTTGMTYVDDNCFLKIEVLAPNEVAKKEFVEVYESKYENTIVSDSTIDDDYDKTLEELSEVPYDSKAQKVNNSSISFLLTTVDGKKFLFLGDVKEEQIIETLKSKGISEANKLEVDCMKVPHHGSKYNLSEGLLNLISCEHFIISTIGGHLRFRHPDRQTLAKIIFYPKPKDRDRITIHLNYDRVEMKKHKSKFLHDEEIEDKERYNFDLDENCECL